MGGDGKIGGGSCYVNFAVDGKSKDDRVQRLAAFDDHVKVKACTITVTFPKGGTMGTTTIPAATQISVPLDDGNCVELKWG